MLLWPVYDVELRHLEDQMWSSDKVSLMFQCIGQSQQSGLIGQKEDIAQYTGHIPHFHL